MVVNTYLSSRPGRGRSGIGEHLGEGTVLVEIAAHEATDEFGTGLCGYLTGRLRPRGEPRHLVRPAIGFLESGPHRALEQIGEAPGNAIAVGGETLEFAEDFRFGHPCRGKLIGRAQQYGIRCPVGGGVDGFVQAESDHPGQPMRNLTQTLFELDRRDRRIVRRSRPGIRDDIGLGDAEDIAEIVTAIPGIEQLLDAVEFDTAIQQAADGPHPVEVLGTVETGTPFDLRRRQDAALVIHPEAAHGGPGLPRELIDGVFEPGRHTTRKPHRNRSGSEPAPGMPVPSSGGSIAPHGGSGPILLCMDEMADARPSVAERERALQELSQQMGAGRLSVNEFDERSALAGRADTKVELAALFTDLPLVTPDPPTAPAPTNPLPSLTVLTGAITVFAVVSAWASGNWLWLLLIAATPVAVLVWRARDTA